MTDIFTARMKKLTSKLCHLTSKLYRSCKKLGCTKPTVAVIPLRGIIGSSSGLSRSTSICLQNFEEPIKKAFENKNIAAVALVINSPGGSPVQSKQIAQRIRQMAQKHKKPVYSFCEDVAASGGYWLALAADEIYADQSSIVGSIGVISASFGFDQMLQKIGVQRRVYTSGKSKSTLDPFLPEKKQDVEHLKKVQKDIHQQFIEAVQQRRKDKIQPQDKEIFSGLWFSGIEAQTRGLIDHCGEMRSVCQQKHGDKVKFKYFAASQKGIARLFSGGAFMQSRNNPTEEILNALKDKILRDQYGI